MSDNNTQNNPVYIKSVELENYGPCKNVKYNFRFDENGNPIPLILIGKNGGGKTIFLSHIINALIAAKQVIYDNCEIEKGYVYKLRSPKYIYTGSLYSFSRVDFTTNNATVTEWQLIDKKEALIKKHGLNFPNSEWANIPNDGVDYFGSTFTLETARNLIDNGCIQYFPSNRFEEPAWLNIDNLTSPIEYLDLKKIKNISDRSIISLSTLKESQKWLFEILLDRSTLELQSGQINLPVKAANADENTKAVNMPLPLMLGYHGQATLIYNEILKLLNQLFDMPQGTLRFGLGNRRSRQLSIMKNDQSWIPNLFQLSSGESLLLDLFLCIIKDFDLSNSNLTRLSDVKGIVLIDEIDLHLHINLQKDILPRLIKLLPRIQFVITTHSPMFLLGMQKVYGTNGFDILEMPSAESISVENFTEFQDLLSAIRETKTYIDTLNIVLNESQLPVVFVEGDYDIKYITKTIELFYNEQNLFNQFKLLDSNGYGNLDKIWKSMDSKVVDVLSVKTLLLYDCDISKEDNSKGKVTRKVTPTNSTNTIKKGIENLLSDTTIRKLQSENTKFIDVTTATTKIERGITVSIPEIIEVNKDEKRNICEWLCQNGDATDFEGFKTVVDIIIGFLNENKVATT